MKFFTLLLSVVFILNCAGVPYPGRTRNENPLFRERAIFVDYALALSAYHQKDYERSLELSLDLIDETILHPYIGRLIVRNRLGLEQWEEIEKELHLLGNYYEDFYLKGRYYYLIGDYAEARRYLSALAPYYEGAKALEVYRMLLEVYTAFEEWEKFSHTAVSILGKLPSRREPFFRAALFTLLERQQPEAAADYFHQSLRYVSLDDDSMLFYVLLMIRFFEEEQVPELTNAFLKNIIDKKPFLLEIYLEYMVAMEGEKDFEEAEELFLMYLDDYPEKVIPYYFRFLVSREQHQAFLRLLDEYSGYIESNEELVKIAGIYFFNRGMYDRARHYFELSRDISEPDVQVNMMLLSSILKSEEIAPREGWNTALEIISENPDEETGSFFLLRIFSQIPGHKRSELRDKYFDIIPESPLYYHNGASLFVTDEMYLEAMEIIHKGLEIYPDQENLLLKKSYVLYKMDELDRAESVYKQLLEQETTNPYIYNNLAYLWAEKNKNLEQALEYAYISLEKVPDDPSVLDTVGWIYFLKEQYDQAEHYLEKAGEKLLQYYEEGLYTSTEALEIIGHLIYLYEETGEEQKLERWKTKSREIREDME